MKKTLLLTMCALAVMLTHSALATISLTATPSTQNVAAGGTFNVQISLNVTQNSAPANVVGYDLLLEAATPQNGTSTSGLFSITGTTSNVANWTTRTGVPSFPESMTTANSNHSGFVQNQHDLGYTGDPGTEIATPISGLNLETISISLAPGTPAGTYTFFTTSQTTSGTRGSSVSDASGNAFFVNQPASFQITVGAVPEPATWSLLGFGALSTFGLNFLRARRRSS
jgi:hypothetical protein